MNRLQKNIPGPKETSRTLLDLGYRGIIDLLPCYLSIQDPNMNILFTNENFRKDFGEGVGSPCHVAYKGSDDLCDACPVRETFEDEQSHQ